MDSAKVHIMYCLWLTFARTHTYPALLINLQTKQTKSHNLCIKWRLMLNEHSWVKFVPHSHSRCYRGCSGFSFKHRGVNDLWGKVLKFDVSAVKIMMFRKVNKQPGSAKVFKIDDSSLSRNLWLNITTE